MTDAALPSPRKRGNNQLAFWLALVVVGMVGMAYAAVPLYQMFCEATGFGGTTQRAESNPKGVIDRVMTVRFDSNVEGALPWVVTPAKPDTAKIGTVETIVFRARNDSDKTVTGQAVFNVTPETAGIYFNKIQCFCFTQQTLKPHESVDMPVVYFVDPDIAQNGDLDTLREITLSYTFYAETKGS
jgi:cytochrome c oxidase assembly protein subunit 11